MGQAPSHEKKKRGNRGYVDSGQRGTDLLHHSSNKNGKKHSSKNHASKEPGNKKHWHKQQRQLRKQMQQPNTPDLPDGVKGVPSPRYGIFDEVKPTVCLDEEGVSLSSASSDEGETTPTRSTPCKPTHRCSTRRRLSRTFSASGRRRTRAARMVKKNQKAKQSQVVGKDSTIVMSEEIKSSAGVPDQVIHKETYTLSQNDPVAMLSADDSGCSTLDDNLFQDDSLSEEVFGCWMSDNDTRCQPSHRPVMKCKRDEGYESLQKIAQGTPRTEGFDGTLEQVRQMILSSSSEKVESSDSSPGTHIAMNQLILRKSSLTSDDQLSISCSSEAVKASETLVEKSSTAGSLSGSGYSTNRKLFVCEKETSPKLETENSAAIIDSPENSPACVDDDFNNYFARVLTMTKTPLFYPSSISSPTLEGTARATNAVSQHARDNNQSNHSTGIALVLAEESDDVVITPVTAGTTESATHIGVPLGDTNGRNPSEVYV